MSFDIQLDSDLWNGERCIGMFIHRKETYWIIDHKYNFTLDAEADYRAYLNKGHINEEQYKIACKEFRGGILKLSDDNFLEYLKLDSVISVNSDELKNYFISTFSNEKNKELYQEVENHLVYGSQLTEDSFRSANQLSSKLPLFYINFDKKMYLHMDWDRCHEDLAPENWHSKASDFSHFILDSDAYWRIDNHNYWRFKYL